MQLQYQPKKEGGRGGKEDRKKPGPGRERKSRAEDPPERDGDTEKETENRARERDAQYLTPASLQIPDRETDCWHEAQSEAVTEKKRQRTVKGASRSLAGQVEPPPAPMVIIHLPRSGHLAGRKTEPQGQGRGLKGGAEETPQGGRGGRRRRISQ